MKPVGWYLQWNYRLRRHLLFGLPLDIWVTIGWLAGGYAVWRRSGSATGGIMLAGVGLLAIILSITSRRVGYLFFLPEPEAVPPKDAPTLPADANLLIKASGPFAIRNQSQYLVEHPTILTIPRSGEHILMAEQKKTRLLLIAQTRENCWGWWYQFIKPDAIISLQAGQIIHGWHPRPGLRIRYRSEDQDGKESELETILSFEKSATRELVWASFNQQETNPQR